MNTTYRIVFRHQLLSQTTLDQAQQALEDLFELLPQTASKIVEATKPIILLRGLNKGEALQYIQFITSHKLRVHLEAISDTYNKQEDTAQIICPRCGQIQPIRTLCRNCSANIAHYYLNILKEKIQEQQELNEYYRGKITKIYHVSQDKEKQLYNQASTPHWFSLSLIGRWSRESFLEALLTLTGLFIGTICINFVMSFILRFAYPSVAENLLLYSVGIASTLYSWGLTRACVLRGQDNNYPSTITLPVCLLLSAGYVFFILRIVFFLFTTIHYFALKVLIYSFPIAFIIMLIKLFCLPHQATKNRYGPPSQNDPDMVFVPLIYQITKKDLVFMYSRQDNERCNQLRNQLIKEKIPFTEYNIDLDPTRGKLLWLKTQRNIDHHRMNDKLDFPVFEVNGHLLLDSPDFTQVKNLLFNTYDDGQ